MAVAKILYYIFQRSYTLKIYNFGEKYYKIATIFLKNITIMITKKIYTILLSRNSYIDYTVNFNRGEKKKIVFTTFA